MIIEVEGDGSCFFRSLADQLEYISGDEKDYTVDHQTLRKRIISNVRANRTMYEPFMEDDEPFDEYVDRMEEEGEWAGNVELQAASLELGVNIRIYQAGQAPWTVKNHSDSAPLLHLSYHDGSHYNSVRPINGKYKNMQPTDMGAVDTPAGDDPNYHDKEKVAKLGMDGKHINVVLTVIGKGKRQKVKVRLVVASVSRKKQKDQPKISCQPARNAECPCGSKRKYKNCCGSKRGIIERKIVLQNADLPDELIRDVETLYI